MCIIVNGVVLKGREEVLKIVENLLYENVIKVIVETFDCDAESDGSVRLTFGA